MKDTPHKIACNPDHPDHGDEVPVDSDGATCYEAYDKLYLPDRCCECESTRDDDHEFDLVNGEWSITCVARPGYVLPFAEGGAYDGS